MTQKVMLLGQDGTMHTYEMRQDYTRVSDMGGTESDPNWVFTDAAGHEHRADKAGLTRTTEPSYWCPDCHDEHDGDSHFVCAQCGEEIKPGTRFRAAGVRMIPGMREFRIDGEYVAPGEFETRYAAAVAEATR